MNEKNVKITKRAKYNSFYSHSKAETIIDESDIDDIFESIYITIISNIQKSLGKGSGWITDLTIQPNINISKYNPLAGSSYIKFPKELAHSRKGLINTQKIDDNGYFKWCLVRYLNPVDHHLARIRKADKVFAKKLNFKDIKFPVKKRDIHKIEKKNSISISVFGYENNKKHPTYVSKLRYIVQS